MQKWRTYFKKQNKKRFISIQVCHSLFPVKVLGFLFEKILGYSKKYLLLQKIALVVQRIE